MLGLSVELIESNTIAMSAELSGIGAPNDAARSPPKESTPLWTIVPPVIVEPLMMGEICPHIKAGTVPPPEFAPVPSANQMEPCA